MRPSRSVTSRRWTPPSTTRVGPSRMPSWKMLVESIGPPGSLRADVEPVGAARGEADELVAAEDRPEDRHVVEVGAGQVGVVHDPDVARTPRLAAVHLLRQARADLEVAEEDRQAGRLPEDAVVGVEQRDRAVLHLVDDRRVRRADEGRVHLVGGGRERAADDLGGDRVDDRGSHHASSPVVDDERAEGVDPQACARRHDRRRSVLRDDRRPLDDRARREVVRGGRSGPAASGRRRPPRAHRGGTRPARRAARRPARLGRGRRAPSCGRRRARPARRGSRGRSASRAPRGSASRAQRRSPAPAARRHRAAGWSGCTPARRSGCRAACSTRPVARVMPSSARLSKPCRLELREGPGEVGAIGGGERGEVGAARGPCGSRSPACPRRRTRRGSGGTIDLGDPELAGQEDGVHRPGAAEGDEREVARLDALLDGERADRLRHLRVDDVADALGELAGPEPQLGGEPGDGGLGRARRRAPSARRRSRPDRRGRGRGWRR